MNKNHKKFKLHFTMFGALVLVIVLSLLFQVWRGKTEPIFDDNITTTFYAKTQAGTAPELLAESYFTPEKYDLTKFWFDLTQCDYNTAGVYRVPVLYDGEKTNCVVQIEVKALAGEPEKIPDMNGNTAITGLQ